MEEEEEVGAEASGAAGRAARNYNNSTCHGDATNPHMLLKRESFGLLVGHRWYASLC